MNGTIYGKFRCPLYGFPQEAKSCCGDYGEQFCCIRERSRFVFFLEKSISFQCDFLHLVVFQVELVILDGLF